MHCHVSKLISAVIHYRHFLTGPGSNSGTGDISESGEERELPLPEARCVESASKNSDSSRARFFPLFQGLHLFPCTENNKNILVDVHISRGGLKESLESTCELQAE